MNFKVKPGDDDHMLKTYLSTESGQIIEDAELTTKGVWISLISPTNEEREIVSKAHQVPLDFLEYPLDEEEMSRIEYEDSGILIIIRVPIEEGTSYNTIPLGIIITENVVITVCFKENPVLEVLTTDKSRMKGFFTFKRTRFLLNIMFNSSLLYLHYLRQIDKKSDLTRAMLEHSTRNKELMELLDLGKSLVYFTTSLRSNEIVMEKIRRSYLMYENDGGTPSRFIKMYEEDKDLLDDVITENKQALEMGEIYSSILNTTMDAFASVISNNLNIALQILTALTIALAIPTAVASFYGMNVLLPGQDEPLAFWWILLFSAVITLIVVSILRRRRMF